MRKILLAICLVACSFVSFQSFATSYTVTNGNDSGPGSLREKVDSANMTPGIHDIYFSQGFNILLSSTITLDSTINIYGIHPDSTIIDGGGTVRAFQINSDNAQLIDMTITNCIISGQGAAIMSTSNASLQLHNMQFYHNDAGGGGEGGAVHHSGAGSLNANSCTFWDNKAGLNGGAIALSSTAGNEIRNCTFLEDSATNGGAIYYSAVGPLDIYHCTFVRNGASSEGGAIYTSGSPVEVSNSLFDNNSASTGPNIRAFSVLLGLSDFNFIVDTTGGSGSLGTNSIDSGIPEVDSILSNPDNTYPSVLVLAPSSICIDHVDTSLASVGSFSASDARGVPRDSFPDVGAYEDGSAGPGPCALSDYVGDVPGSPFCDSLVGGYFVMLNTDPNVTYYALDTSNMELLNDPVPGTGSADSALIETINDSTVAWILAREKSVIVEDGWGAWDFDGTGALMSNVPGFQVGTNDFTVEAWIHPTAIGQMGIVSTGDPGCGNPGFRLELMPDSSIRLETSAGACNSVSTSPGIIIPNQWFHIGARIKRGGTDSAVIYIDGSPAGMGTIPADDLTSSRQLIIGANDAASNRFQGMIDEVRLWDHGRSPFEMMTQFDLSYAGNEFGLQHYFPFEEEETKQLSNDWTHIDPNFELHPQGGLTIAARTSSNGKGACMTLMSVQLYIDKDTACGACSVDVGPDFNECATIVGDSIFLNGVVSGAGNLNWNSSGTGGFSTLNTATTYYTPSTVDTSNGFVDLLLEFTSGGCLGTKDSLTVLFNQPPTANAGLDQNICANDSAQLIGSSNGLHFHWFEDYADTFHFPTFDNDTLLTVWYKPSAYAQFTGMMDVILLASDTSGCPPVEDTVHITITTKPDVFAGFDVSDTTGGSIALNGSVVNALGGVWSSSGSGSFAPDNMTLNATYTPSATDLTNGVAELTLTSTGNGTCNAESDEVFLTLVGCGLSPTINIVNNNLVQFQSNLANQSAAGHFYWDFGDGTIGYGPNPEHTYDAINNYNVTVGFTTSDFGCFDTATVNVNISALTTTTQSIDGTVRAGGTPLDTGFVVLFKEVNSQYDLIGIDDIGSSDAGTYSFDNLVDGNYLVNAFPVPSSAFFWTYVPTYYDADTSWQAADVIVINGADSMNMDIAMFNQPGDSTFASGADTIFGSVYVTNADTNARDVNDGSVSANAVTVKLYNSSGTLITQTVTDNFGNFSFPNLAAGAYTVTLEYAGTGVTKTIPYVVDGNSSTKEQSSTTSQKTNTTTVGLGGSYTVISNGTITLSPNPATSVVNVSIDDPNFKGGVYVIINALGQPVGGGSAGDSTQIDVESLSSGTYHVIISDDDHVYRVSFIKE